MLDYFDMIFFFFFFHYHIVVHIHNNFPSHQQELLVRAGAVLWLDASVRLVSEVQDANMAAEKMAEWSSWALKNGGVLTWPLPHPALLPTAALTHPNMFTFFHTKKNYYDFQQVILPMI